MGILRLILEGDWLLRLNCHKFTQNENLQKNYSGTTMAQACPFQGESSTGYFATEKGCHNKNEWTGRNKLGEILTNVREEIQHMPASQGNVLTKITNIGVSIEPEVDIGTLQRACPKLGHYFQYIENKIRPSDAKWDRRVLNDYRDYYIEDDVLWHVNVSNMRGQTRSIQDYMHQNVLPVCMRHQIIHNYHDVGLCHAGSDRTVMALRRHYYWHSMTREIKKYIKTCTACQEGKRYNRYKALLKLAIPNRFGQTLHIDHVGPIKAGPNGEKYDTPFQ